ncbi:hypothetical protein N2W52_001901 [Clostridium perfringens]|nr:hypothetical protein [Clostridium perfringens]
MEYEKVSSSTMELLKNDMKNNYEVIMKKNTDSNGRPVAKRIENEIKKVYNGIIVLTQIPNEFYRVRIDGMVEITENRELKENEYRVDYISGKVYFNPVKEGQDIKVSLYYGDGVELIPTSRIYIGLNRYGEPVKTLHEVLKESIDSLDALNKVGGVIKEGDRLNNTLNTTINNANSTDNKVNETIETANATNNTLNSTIKNSENHNNILNETIINSESKNNTLNNTIETSMEKNSVLNDTINNANSTNNKVNKTIGVANDTDNKVKSTINNANNTNSTLINTIKNSETHNNTLNDTIKNSETHNNTLNTTIKNSVEKDNVLTYTIAKANETNDKVNNTIGVADKTNDKVNTTINNANSTDNKVNNTIKNAETHINTLNTTIENANKTNEKVNTTINNANSTDNKVNITTDNAKVMNNILNDTIKDSKTKNSDLNETIIKSVEKDNLLKTTIETANSTNTNVNGTIKIANETNNVLGTSIKRFTDSNNTLNTTVNNANLTNDKVNKTIGVADATNNIVNSSIGKAETINKTLGTTIEKAETDNKTLTDTISTAETKNTALTKAVSDSNSSKINLEATINNAKSTDGTLKGTISNANNSNTTLNNTIKDSVGKNSSLADTISQVKNNNDTLIATIDRANSTNNTLNGSNNTAKATKTELDKSISEAKTVIGNTNDLLTGVQTNKKDIADLKERVVKTNNYLEVDTKGNNGFRIENTLEGKTEELKIEGRTLVNIIKMKDFSMENIGDIGKFSDNKITINKPFVTNQAIPLPKEKIPLLKPNTVYTVMAKITNNTMTTFFNIIHCYKEIMLTKNEVRVEAKQNGYICKTFKTIDNLNNGSRIEIAFPQGCSGKVEISNMMIIEGDLTSTFIDGYFEGTKSVGEIEGNKISILSHGANLMPINTLEQYGYGVAFNIDNNEKVTIKGTNEQYVGYDFRLNIIDHRLEGWGGDEPRQFYTDDKGYYDIDYSKDYIVNIILKNNKTLDESGIIASLNVVYEDYSIDKVHFTKATSFYNSSIKLKKGLKVRGIFFGCWYSNQIFDLEFNIQLTEGTVAPKYYNKTIHDKKDILISAPLRSVDDVQDIMYEDNGQVKVDRKLGKYTFTGNESIIKWADSPNACWFKIRNSFKINYGVNNSGTELLCDNFRPYNHGEFSAQTTINNSVTGITAFEDYFTIRIEKSKLSTQDVEGFKAWLKANPTTIVYQLATPTIEIVENCVDIDLDTYKDLTYISSNNTIIPQITCKIPKNLVTTVQETTNRVNDLEKIMYGIEGLKNFEGKGEYLEYDNTNTGFINNCVIEGKTLENLFDINNSFVYADINDYYYHEMDIRENNLDVNKVYSVYYENLNMAYSCGSIIFFKDKTTNISEVSFSPNTWEKFTIPKETKYLLYRGLRKSAKYTEHNNGFRFTVLEGDWTNKNTPKYFYGYGSVGEKSKNLFNGEIESGSIDVGTKREIEDSNKFRSAFISIVPNTYYTLSFKDIKGGTSLVVAEYDYNKNIIKTSTVGNQQSFLTDVRSIYVKITGENERVENIQIEEGKKATAFENNYEGYKIKLSSFSKNNLWNKGMVSLCSYNASINYYDLKDLNNIRITNTNEGIYNYVFLNLEYLKPNTNYTFSFDSEKIIGSPYVSIREIEKQYKNDANKATKVYGVSSCNENKRYEIRFTTSADIGKNKIVTIGFYSTTDKKTKSDCYFKNIVLTETKDYKDNFVSGKLDEKTLMIKEPLRNLNDFSDKIEKIEGVYKVNRIIGEKRLDGSENWRGWQVNDKYCCFHLNLDNAEGDWAKQKYLKCNKMKNDVNSAYGVQKESCALDERGLLYMCIEKAKLKTPDVNGFKAWLQNNVVNILYKLRVPSIEDLLSSDRPNLKTYNDSTVISTLNNTIVPIISFEIPRNLSEIVKNNTDTIKENSESAKTISSAIAKNSINIMVNKNTEKVLTSKIVQTTLNLNKTNTTLNSFISQKNQEITTINKKLVELDGLLIASTTAPENLNALWLDITD